LANKAILVVDQINQVFGECVIMLHCAGLKDGLIITKNYIQTEQIAPLIKGTLLEAYKFVEDDKNSLRERLLEESSQLQIPCNCPIGTMPVDHYFSVKGVGMVVLGCIVDGAIKKHDELMVLPENKIVQVRSIQKHDEDFDCAGLGDRTGIALKGVDEDDLDRGTILTSDKSVKSASSLVAKAEIVKYWPVPLKVGMVLHIGHWMQFVQARIESLKDEEDRYAPELNLKLDKMLFYKPGAEGVLMYPEGSSLRVIGKIELP
jgi:selenocysteine-specific translation elongation factor